MRYFGHDFQQFDGRAYNVIEGMMDTFARQKCMKVTAEYGNPTEYLAVTFIHFWRAKVYESHS